MKQSFHFFQFGDYFFNALDYTNSSHLEYDFLKSISMCLFPKEQRKKNLRWKYFIYTSRSFGKAFEDIMSKRSINVFRVIIDFRHNFYNVNLFFQIACFISSLKSRNVHSVFAFFAFGFLPFTSILKTSICLHFFAFSQFSSSI